MVAREVEVFAAIHAPVERVWELVSDITLMPDLSAELQRVEWADGFDRPCPGAQFLGTNRHDAIGTWTTRSQITACEPPRVFEWAVGDVTAPAAVWRFDLSPATDGTQLRYSARLGPGKSGVTMLIDREPDRAEEIVARRMGQFSAAIQTVVAGIKRIAETGA